MLAAVDKDFSGNRGTLAKFLSSAPLLLVPLAALATVYSPVASAQQGTFVPTGSMNVSRGYATATLLKDGRVLIAGGYAIPYTTPEGAGVSSAELYDPATGQFTLTGNMTTPRFGHTSTLLSDGRVLIAGGSGSSNATVVPGSTFLHQWPVGGAAELYDPTSGTFTATAPMVYSRNFHTATLLNDGKVLLAGGQTCFGNGCSPATAELYDPAAGTFTATGNLVSSNSTPGLRDVLLDNGKVLLVGGYYALGATSAQIYDPKDGTFTRLDDPVLRYTPTATKLNNGVVLIAGAGVFDNSLSWAELYDPVTNTFNRTGDLITGRSDHTGTLLENGMVLITGGATGSTSPAVDSAELYDPASAAFSVTGSLITARMDATATLLQNGTVLIAGGLTTASPSQGESPTLSSAELYEQVGITPGSLLFSNQAAHTVSAPQTVRLTNNLPSPLNIASITVSGANASDFTETSNCVQNLPAGSSCSIEVTFTPVAVGTRTANLTIANGISPSPMQIQLNGTGVAPAPVVSLSSTEVSFGTQTLEVASAPQIVTLTNTGNANLIIQSVSLGGGSPADFVIANGSTCKNNATVAPTASCAIQLTFLSMTLGSRTAAVSITDNAAESPDMIGLSGTGTPVPVVSVTPSSVSFPTQYVGTSGIPQSVTLTNNGSVALNVTGITASPSDFGVLNACGNTVAVGASCAIGIFFDPTAGGPRSGTLTIADNGSGSPQTVALTGSAQDFSMTPGSGASATVSAGQTANYTVSLAPAGGFAQSVSLTCAGAPTWSTCSVSPGTIALSAKLATTATVTVATTARSMSWPVRPGTERIPLILLLVGASFLLVLVLSQRRLNLQWLRFCGTPALAIALLAGLALTLTSCGGGSSSGGGGGSGTQAGNYTISVTGSFNTGSTNLAHTTNLTLVVR